MLDSDPVPSLPPGGGPLTRRALVKASLSLGFCAAASPVWAQTITTSADGLIAGEVKISAEDADIPAYRAAPAAGGFAGAAAGVAEALGAGLAAGAPALFAVGNGSG